MVSPKTCVFPPLRDQIHAAFRGQKDTIAYNTTSFKIENLDICRFYRLPCKLKDLVVVNSAKLTSLVITRDPNGEGKEAQGRQERPGS